MQISTWQAANANDILQLFVDTFSDAEGAEEGAAIGELVADLIETTHQNDLLGYIAFESNTTRDNIIGSIFFSRIRFETQRAINAFILSPVAVKTNHQGQGVGQQLIHYGIEQLKDQCVDLLFTYGDPRFYSKVGFTPISEALIQAPLPLSQPEGWLCQSLDGSVIHSINSASHCVDALRKPEHW